MQRRFSVRGGDSCAPRHVVLQAGHAVVGRTLDRLHPAPPLAPHAQCQPGLRQQPLGRVHVSCLQTRARCRRTPCHGSVDSRTPLLRHLKLQFYFMHDRIVTDSGFAGNHFAWPRRRWIENDPSPAKIESSTLALPVRATHPMPLFWKSYTSDVTSFIEELKARKPTLENEQRQGRALLWDKRIDLDVQAEYGNATVAQQSYVYQTKR